MLGNLMKVTSKIHRLEKKVSLEDQPVPAFRFARVAVRRAVANLIDNALRYAGEPVDVRSRQAGNQIIIEVLDRGPGIPETETDRLKRPFTRLDASRAGPGGSGLGLAIVERVARTHGGTLELLPRRDGGRLVARLILRIS